jgi:hypothetical protein
VAEQQHDRDGHGQQQPAEHAQHQDAEQCEQGQGEAVAPQPPDPPQGGQVEEPDDGADHDRAKGGLGQVPEQGQQGHRGQHGRPGHQQRHQLGVGAGAVVGGRLAGPAGDEALEQAGQDVGDAGGGQLPVRLDAVAVLVGQGLAHGGGLGVADDGDRQRARQQRQQLVPPDVGERRGGHGALDPADDGPAVVGQAAQGDHDDAGHHHQGRRDVGAARLRPSSRARPASPTAAVQPLASPRWVTRCHSWGKKSPPPLETPSRAGTCPTMIVSPRPNMNPACTAAEMKRDTNPTCRTPSTTSTMPTRMARAADRSRKRAGSPRATGVTSAAEMAAVPRWG